MVEPTPLEDAMREFIHATIPIYEIRLREEWHRISQSRMDKLAQLNAGPGAPLDERMMEQIQNTSVRFGEAGVPRMGAYEGDGMYITTLTGVTTSSLIVDIYARANGVSYEIIYADQPFDPESEDPDRRERVQCATSAELMDKLNFLSIDGILEELTQHFADTEGAVWDTADDTITAQRNKRRVIRVVEIITSAGTRAVSTHSKEITTPCYPIFATSTDAQGTLATVISTFVPSWNGITHHI